MHTQLSLVLAAVLSIIPRASAYVYSTQSLCKTAYATTSPASVKSTSVAITIPLTFISKYTATPTTTVTPKPISTTVTTTSTVTNVRVPTTISTAYSTTISTSIVITTTTQIIDGGTTTSTGTSTVPTVAGFTPLASGAHFAAKKRSLPEKRAAASPYCQLPPPSSPHSFSPKIYPTAVTCGYLVEAITTIAKTIPATTTGTKILAPSTITSTSTVFTTVSVISGLQSGIITSTISKTTTTTSVVTTSTTTTVTVVAPSATFYAACAANNLIDSANTDPATGPQGITVVAYTNWMDDMISTSDTTAYDCCVSCQTASGCEGYAFLASTAACYYIANSDTCDGSDFSDLTFATSPIVPAGAGYTIGDGPCGQYGDENI